MSRNHLTQWIEDAEARHVFEDAMVGRGWAVTETHFLHLGDAIAKVPFHAVGHELMAFGAHMLDRVRHPLGRWH